MGAEKPEKPEQGAESKSEEAGAKPSESKPVPASKPSSKSQSSSKPSKKKEDERRRNLRWGIVALAVLVAVIAWVATQGDDGDSGESEASSAGGFAAKVVSEEELVEIADEAGHDVYWAGPIDGTELEASEAEDGRVTVRYLAEGTEVGSDEAGTLTIGSYPVDNAAQALQGFAERDGSIVREGSDGEEVVSSTSAPSSVYFASPDGTLQIEVYDPSPARAMSLARSGDVQPVG